VLLHGAGGPSRYWVERFTPYLRQAGMAVYAPHFFDATGTERATKEMIRSPEWFCPWLAAVHDAVRAVAAEPQVDAARIALLGVSLGGFLTMGAVAEGAPVRAALEISGGMPVGWEEKLTPRTSPVLVLHGDADGVVPVSEAEHLRTLLQEHSVPHRVEILEGEGHWFSPQSLPQILWHCWSFLREHLR
jgi:carboxymethylenebutenolidase